MLHLLRSHFLQRKVTRLLFISALLIALGMPQSAPAALSPSPLLLQTSSGTTSRTAVSGYSLGWVWLDGYQVFQIAAPQSALSQRQQRIEANLAAIRDDYLQMASPLATLTSSQVDRFEPLSLFVNGLYLFTLTPEDATQQGMTISAIERSLRQQIPQVLARAYEQRQPEYVRRQLIKAALLILVAIAVVGALQQGHEQLFNASLLMIGRRSDQLEPQQRQQLQDLQLRLLPLGQGLILVGTVLWVAGFWPQTRSLQNNFLAIFKLPLIIGIVIGVAYVGIRLSYLLIDRFVNNLTEREGFNRGSRRLQLRISTIASAIKNLANFVWLGIGLFVALAATGINLGVLLASFGLIGLALSLAAQNLIKGAVRGFFIILEDQYAIGDVVAIDQDAGLVENMNLRITQLRDTGGRLITIPTSDINRVANYSQRWSRADLKLPVHYNANIDQMLDLARQVGADMQADSDWQTLILEDPKILGVDDFGDSALIIRVWIKTQPMKQWDVSREYRRRFQLAMQETDTSIPFPQREIWLHPAEAFTVEMNQPKPSSDTAKNNGQAQTEAQPKAVPDSAEAESEV
ncbi:mechanosensitive ion channel family protein [Almyronema epifaneia]|uniref:Mechanosensitive ion channel family protein n=1 Tax=Almyronema epifaneia S1 TaxID=2991925 RepID=A0ABW6IEH5_9CYAN